MPLVILTGFITTLAIMAAWPVTLKPKLFYFLMLAMYGGQIAVFAVQDMLLFFLVWELELVPVYLILSIWGGKRRLYAATKFILYTAGGSLFILIGALTMAFYGDTATFDMSAIAAKNFPVNLQLLLYAGFLIAYGVKLPIFPLHTWLPDAHGEATAPAHMLLAGILLKMGGYALFRMNAGMLPDAHAIFAPVLVILGVVNIIYAALTSFAQRNLKRKIAYSSISHMGFVLQQLLDGSWAPMAFFSKKLSVAEWKELLAAYSSLRHFWFLLEDRAFTSFTDHKPITLALFRVSPPWSALQQCYLAYLSSPAL